MEPATLLGPIDALEPYVEYVILGLIVLNMAARARAHRTHVRRAREDGPEAISRDAATVGTNVLLVLASMYYLTVHPHGGMVMAVLVVGLFVTDLFEIEARKVEARKDDPLEKPKAAIAASVLVLLYAAFQALFVFVRPIWSAFV